MAFSKPSAPSLTPAQDVRSHLTEEEIRILARGNVAEQLEARAKAHCNSCTACTAKIAQEKRDARFRLDD